MKKRICLLLPLLLLLAACQLPWQTQEETGQTVYFYYPLSEDSVLGGSNSALGTEACTLTPEEDSPDAVLQAYLRGPQQAGLETAFPSGFSAAVLSLQEGLLTLQVSDDWTELSTRDSVLARACLTLTLTQLSQVEQIRICLPDGQMDGDPMEREDYLLYDDSDSNDQLTVRLYFSDAKGRYLQEESRNSTAAAGKLPEFVLQELLKGPEQRDSLSVLPEGTRLLSVTVSDTVCTVDFSGAFYSNRPQNHTQARLTIFSVVDSLTELDQIDSVRFLCEGASMDEYDGLDLSGALCRQEQVLEAPLSASLDGSLFVPCGSQGLLAEVPTYIHQTGGRSGADAVLNLLLAFTPGYGYENPFPDGTKVLDVQTADGLCQVTFNSAFAQCDADPEQAQKAVRCVVATLCELDGIDQVQIMVNDSVMTSMDLSQPLAPENSWKLP